MASHGFGSAQAEGAYQAFKKQAEKELPKGVRRVVKHLFKADEEEDAKQEAIEAATLAEEREKRLNLAQYKYKPTPELSSRASLRGTPAGDAAEQARLDLLQRARGNPVSRLAPRVCAGFCPLLSRQRRRLIVVRPADITSHALQEASLSKSANRAHHFAAAQGTRSGYHSTVVGEYINDGGDVDDLPEAPRMTTRKMRMYDL